MTQTQPQTLDETLRAKRAAGTLKRVDLPAQHERAWTETRTAMLVSCPMFSHILYTMLVPNNPQAKEHIAYFTTEVPVAATDNYEIFINPETFFTNYTLGERVFILGHEIMHCVFNHPGLGYSCQTRDKVTTQAGKTYPYIHDIMNMAMDYVINDLLKESRVGAVPKNCLHDTNIGTREDSVMDVYGKLYEKFDKNGQIQNVGGGQGGMGSDVLSPGSGQGQDPASGASGRNEQEWQTTVAAAAASAKLQGKLPAAIEKAFGEVLEPAVDWTDIVKSFFARKVGSGGYDWRRCERQMIARGVGSIEGDAVYAPGRSGFGAGTIVVGMDSSGSIYCDASLIDRWMGELSGILNDLRPKRIVVIWCDAAVQRVDEVEDGADLENVRRKGAKGGGGTSFVPVFEEVEKMGLTPDALVYLTDGYGTFPAAPGPTYPVLWGNITPGYEKNYPFGEVVTIPVTTT